MKSSGIVLASLMIVALIIGSVSCGGEQTANTPTPTLITTSTSTPFPTSTPSPEPTQNGCIGQLFSYHIMEGDTREVTVTCPECGTHVTHNYTIDQKYICETCGTSFYCYTGIALIKDGAAFTPLREITGVLGYLGFQNHIKTTIDMEPLAGTRFWEGTAPNTYYWDTDTASIEWSEADPYVIKINGAIQQLGSMPFKEDSQHVAYYEDGPRYKDQYQISTGVGSGFIQCRIIYLPIAEFIEPLGYSVQQKGDTVFICE